MTPTASTPSSPEPPHRTAAPARPALARLAEAYGVELVFEDALGRTVETPPGTQCSLLAAMGVRVETDADAEAALAALERAEWSAMLPPVAVVRAAHPVVEAVLPAGTTEVTWRVDLEDGGTRDGRAGITTLRLVDGRELDGAALERRSLRLPPLPPGYHRIRLVADAPGVAAAPGLDAATELIATPDRCWLPPAIEGGGDLTGLSLQLYLLRSASNWGIGDFGDLARLAATAARHGCGVIGLNPLHAMFPDTPERASPYSPASRLFLNPLYIHIESLPEFAADENARALADDPAFRARLEACRSADRVDYTAVTALKLEILGRLFVGFARDGDPERRAAFEAYRREAGEDLERTSAFLALRSRYAADDPATADWRRWPEPFRRPDGPEVRRFIDDNQPAIEFLCWLQWLADEQLAAAARAARDAGMDVGLYRDLAVGADRAGAETWTNPDAVIAGATVGAPPDIFNPAGQNWGLPPFNPRALRQERYRSFIALVRANMRHAGGLRIDHVMGLQHLYCIPDGGSAESGAYVAYPLDDLVGILALESRRHRCLVVGEDLGTVPDGFRERMEAAAVLSYRILFFEQDFDTGTFRPPAEYPRLALAAAGSHDLPTVAAWWRGLDIDLKESLGLYPDPDEAAGQRERRRRDRRGLVAMLRDEGLLPAASADTPDGDGDGEDEDRIVAAVHGALGRSGSALRVVQIDDMMAETDPVNVPGTDTEHPNWRRRTARTLEDLQRDEGLWALVEAVRSAGPPRREPPPEPASGPAGH